MSSRFGLVCRERQLCQKAGQSIPGLEDVQVNYHWPVVDTWIVDDTVQYRTVIDMWVQEDPAKGETRGFWNAEHHIMKSLQKGDDYLSICTGRLCFKLKKPGKSGMHCAIVIPLKQLITPFVAERNGEAKGSKHQLSDSEKRRILPESLAWKPSVPASRTPASNGQLRTAPLGLRSHVCRA